MSLIKNRAFQILFSIFTYILIKDMLHDNIHRAFYTASLLIKDLLVLLMPITIAIFIANTVASYEKQAPFLIIVIIIFEALSNFSSVWYGYFSAHLSLNFIPEIKIFQSETDFKPLFRMNMALPKWWAADKSSLLGLIVGCFIALTNFSNAKDFLVKSKGVIEIILTKFFAKLIPIFIIGFIANMYKTKILENIVANYLYLFALLVIFIIFYLALLFLLSSGLSFSRWLNHIKNIVPAGLLAFTSGCSLSTMPWTIKAAAKNLENPQFAQAIIPSTTNIQQIGDCIANSFLCYIIYSHFNGHNPSLMVWLNFSIIFVAARYATAAMMGGAIFLMLPIYEHYLGFNNEMIALILALNVVLDPIITSSNVIANGALCRVLEKTFNFFRSMSIIKSLYKKMAIN